MDREKAVQVLKRCEAESYCSHYKRHYCCIGCGQREALDLAIKALEREIEYGQMVVDFTKSETMKSHEWEYDTTDEKTSWFVEEALTPKEMTFEEWQELNRAIRGDAETATTTDCISRQEVLNELKEVPFILHYNCNMEQDELVDTIEEQIRGCTKRMIEALPPVIPPKKVVAQISIDTEEFIERIKEEYEITDKVGEWVRRYCFQQWKCSECEYEIDGKTNYCPNCGAKMKR